MSDGKLRALVEAVERSKTSLIAHDEEVAFHLENESERADLWTEVDVPVDDLRLLFTAADSHLSASSNEGWRVKPLEWEAWEDNEWWTAQPPGLGFGYEVRVNARGAVRMRMPSKNWDSFVGSVEEAKAAAQADYEARIHSAILPPPPSPGEEQTPQSMEQGR